MIWIKDFFLSVLCQIQKQETELLQATDQVLGLHALITIIIINHPIPHHHISLHLQWYSLWRNKLDDLSYSLSQVPSRKFKLSETNGFTRTDTVNETLTQTNDATSQRKTRGCLSYISSLRSRQVRFNLS